MISTWSKLIPALLLAFQLSINISRAASTNGPATLQELRDGIEAIINQPRYEEAWWGVKIVSLDSKQVLFEHNAHKLFSPASNSKLYTMAYVLDRLGPDYRIRTSLYAKTPPDRRGTLKSDLIVYGRGDPTINLKLHGNDIFRALEPLVSSLTNAGVKRIKGDLVADTSYFTGAPYGSGWNWDDLENSYGAEVSALTINDNCLQLLVKPGDTASAPCKISLMPPTGWLTLSNLTRTGAAGSTNTIQWQRPLGENLVYVSGQLPLNNAGHTDDVPVHNPAGMFAGWFKDALTRRGITISGRVRTMDWLDRQAAPLELKQWTEIGSMDSLPVRDIIREVQKPSQNLYTDLMLEHAATRRRSGEPLRPGETTEEAAMRSLRSFLGEAGVPDGETLFDEGSGLSRNNVTTPNATVTLLQYMRQHKDSQVYVDALPIAGVDGTLRRRMRGTIAEGNVRAKTGTLRWAHSLSGYVTTAAGEHLVFSVMLNRFHNADPARSQTADVDAIAVLLAGFTGRSNQ